jgi:GTPase KRas
MIIFNHCNFLKNLILNFRRDYIIRKSDAFILLFDVTSKTSFDSIEGYYKEIVDVKREEYAPIVLIGTKSDLTQKRQVNESDCLVLAEKLNVQYLETSSLNGSNIEEAFKKLVDLIQKKPPKINVPIASQNCCYLS